MYGDSNSDCPCFTKVLGSWGPGPGFRAPCKSYLDAQFTKLFNVIELDDGKFLTGKPYIWWYKPMGFRLRFPLNQSIDNAFPRSRFDQKQSYEIGINMYQYVSITIILNHDYDSIYWNHHISSSFISIHVAQMPQRDTVAGDATSKSWPDQHSCERKALWGFKLEISNASSPAWGQKRATHFGCTFSYYMLLYAIICIYIL